MSRSRSLSDIEQHALSSFKSNDLLKARELYTELCKESETKAESWHMLSAINGMLGLYPEAESCAREVIKLKPGFSGAYNNLGNALLIQGKIEEAMESFEHALRLDPDNAETYTNLGNAWSKVGKFDNAIEYYRKSLAIRPAHAETHNNMGNSMLGLYKLNEAQACFECALNINPAYFDAQFNIGKVYQESGRYDDALDCYKSVHISLPGHLDSWLGIAEVMFKQSRLDEAYTVYIQILENYPGNIKATMGVAGVLVKQQKFEEAVQHCHLAIEKSPQDIDIRYCLGLVYKEAGNTEKAIACFRDVLIKNPDHVQASHFLAIMGGVDAPPRADKRYVASLFDGYATTFDHDLINKLGYQMPWHIRNQIDRISCLHTGMVILDLGCGTGLCGTVFRHYADILIGVDVSSKMINVARERGIYDELIIGDLMVPLSREDAGFDIIIAADVFVYIGDLEEIFHAVSDALKPEGIFAFSIETTNEDVPYVLHSRGRYAQSMGYILSLSKNCNLKILGVDDVVVRYEKGVSVTGKSVLLGCNK